MTNGQRSVIFLAAGLVAGFAVATFMPSDDGADWLAPAGGSLEERIDALERRIASEAAARLVLLDEIDALRAELEAVAAGAAADSASGPARAARTAELPLRAAVGGAAPADDVAFAGEGLQAAEEGRPRRRGPTPEEREQRRIQRFVDAGFTVARAEWIEQRTAELQMQRLEAQYEAARSGDIARARDLPSVEEALRAELGDAEYERYLEATGRPTRIGVRNVLPSSPAAQAGLRPGDEIVSYGGRRVFGMDDLNRLTLEGRPGETVVMEVLRDGQPLQLYVPRGPIGISGGGRRLP